MKHLPHDLRKWWEQCVGYPHKVLSFEAALGSLIAECGAGLLRKRLAPSFSEVTALTRKVYCDPAALLADARWSTPALSGDALTSLAREYEQLQPALTERYGLRRLALPKAWAAGSGTSFLLYALVRGFKPSTVIEMGVGNGHSTYYLLRALHTNGTGRLYSFDIDPGAGGLLVEQERADWDFRLLDRWRAGKSLVAQLDALPRADLCFHDADHSYLAQYFELTRLWERLRHEGILVSDDVDYSYALIDFCGLDDKRPEILIDGRKVVAVLQRR